MSNTRYAVSESSSLVEKLIARTQEGKIDWTEPSYSSDTSETFEAKLDNDLKVSICSEKSGVTFAVYLVKVPERLLLSVTLEHDPSFGYDLPGERELYTRLVELQELARRSALNVDQNLANAREFLERLAG